jgi:osmotically-inducible protein OsmY
MKQNGGERMATAARSAEDIRNDVKEQLTWDTRVDSSNIDVDVIDGIVTLSGSVPTYPDRSQAQTDALQVPGVASVDNGLTVSFPSAYEIPPDAEISFNVTSSLSWSPTVDATRIHVAVSDGEVTLTGKADSFWQKQRAGEIAANTAGVTDVHNELMVTPAAPAAADQDVRRDIIAALERNVDVDITGVDIDVNNGVVTLSGTVGDYRTYRTAEDAAGYTSGVLEVNNHLAIRSPETSR